MAEFIAFKSTKQLFEQREVKRFGYTTSDDTLFANATYSPNKSHFDKSDRDVLFEGLAGLVLQDYRQGVKSTVGSVPSSKLLPIDHGTEHIEILDSNDEWVLFNLLYATLKEADR